MKNLNVLLVAFFLILPTAGIGSDLSTSYSITIGEMIELHCGIWDGLTSFSSGGLLGSTYTSTVYYSKGADNLQVVHFGDRESIDNAKTILDLINQQVIPKIIQYAKTKFSIDINTSEFLLIYRYKPTEKDILMMENGNYVFPK